VDNVKTKLEILPKNIFSVLLVFVLIILGSFMLTKSATSTTAKTWDFSTSSNYTYDDTKIEFSSGQAQLKPTTSWYNTFWTKRKVVTITGSTDGALTNYQLKITVTYDSDMQPDFDDIRFTSSDGTTLIDHWLESKTDSSTADFWVEVPSIPASPDTTTIYMYYGNSSVSTSSDGNSSFDFYDDFTTLPEIPQAVKISIPTTNHNDYGLMYPVTYVFNIPSGSSNLKAYKKYVEGDSWLQITEKTSSDFFNGIEAVRFDYSNNKAYVSAAFNDSSDDIYLKVTDVSDTVVGAYSTIAEYYDNRKAIVSASIDEWVGGDWPTQDGRSWMTSVTEAVEEFQARNIWITVSTTTINNSKVYDAIPNPPDWASIQHEIDEGYVEIASHSRYHTKPITEYDNEIGGSKQDLIDNLDLPYKKGSTEYIPCWVGPGGQWSDTIEQHLGEYKYLADVAGSLPGTTTDWASWTSNNVYGYWNGSRYIEDSNTTTLNSDFDSAYTNGKIYALRGHPDRWNWTTLREHLDYIANKKDVWYVGQGAMYMYHYVKERGVVTVNVEGSTTEIDSTKWTTYIGTGGHIIKTNNVAEFYRVISPNTMEKKTNISAPYTAELEIKYPATVLERGGFIVKNSYVGNNYFYVYGSGGTWDVKTLQSGVFASRCSGGSFTANTWYKILAKVKSNNLKRVEIRKKSDNSLLLACDNIAFTSLSSQNVEIFAYPNDATNYVDTVRIRKYAASEPTSDVGTEFTLLFDTSSPSINPKSSVAQTFTSLSGFSETATKNGGQIKYQVSNDSGITWYWYNTGWTMTTSGYTEANTASDINSNISTFPVESKSFLFKAYFNSDGSQLVQLDSVVLTYVDDTTPPETPTATPSAGSFNSAQLVTLSATGSDYIKYDTSLITSCSAGISYGGPISIPSSETIYALACDNAGNSSTQSFAYIIDSEAPSTAIATPVAGTYSSTQTISLTSAGSDSIRYSTTETPATCSAGTLYTVPISVSTSQTIYVRACDNVDNSSTTNFAYVISRPTSSGSSVLSRYNNLIAMGNTQDANQLQQEFPNQISNNQIPITSLTQATSIVTSTPSTPIIINRILKLVTPRIWGDDVKVLQTFLNTKGYDSGIPDGNFGPKTQTAVIAFQKANGLTPDGVVGPNTVKLMNDSQSTLSFLTPLKTRTLKLSTPIMIGDDVKLLQTYLSINGYDAGTPDGIFGNKTKSAVIAFQTANNLTPDGIVGPLTWGGDE